MDVGEYIRRKQNKEKEQWENKHKSDEAKNMSATEVINRYSSMSEEQLIQELFRVGSVSSGNISAEQLDIFYNKVKNYLTPEQAERMKDLIIQLKMQ